MERGWSRTRDPTTEAAGLVLLVSDSSSPLPMRQTHCVGRWARLGASPWPYQRRSASSAPQRPVAPPSSPA
jgi:hypothetical protein